MKGIEESQDHCDFEMVAAQKEKLSVSVHASKVPSNVNSVSVPPYAVPCAASCDDGYEALIKPTIKQRWPYRV